jgi:hypothetical protein
VINATDTTTNATYYPLFVSTAGTDDIPRIRSTATAFTFNPGTGEVSAVDFNSLSDRTLKTNIVELSDSWAILSQLKPVSFDWLHTEKSSFGFVAQEVEQILPSIISNTSQGKTVAYLQLIPLLVKHLQDQTHQVAKLQGVIDTLRKTLAGDS